MRHSRHSPELSVVRTNLAIGFKKGGTLVNHEYRPFKERRIPRQ